MTQKLVKTTLKPVWFWGQNRDSVGFDPLVATPVESPDRVSKPGVDRVSKPRSAFSQKRVSKRQERQKVGRGKVLIDFGPFLVGFDYGLRPA